MSEKRKGEEYSSQGKTDWAGEARNLGGRDRTISPERTSPPWLEAFDCLLFVFGYWMLSLFATDFQYLYSNDKLKEERSSKYCIRALKIVMTSLILNAVLSDMCRDQ